MPLRLPPLVPVVLVALLAASGCGETAPKPNGDSGSTPQPPLEVETYQGAGVRFPKGGISWADAVVSFTPGNPSSSAASNPQTALGPPDTTDHELSTTYVALGHGGELVLEFTDNVLVDIEGDDLVVFEIGPRVEPTDVAISRDGSAWIEIGRAKGRRSSLDISPFVKGGESFRLVRLRDARAGLSNDSRWPGADIDAVGAIGALPSSRPLAR